MAAGDGNIKKNQSSIKFLVEFYRICLGKSVNKQNNNEPHGKGLISKISTLYLKYFQQKFLTLVKKEERMANTQGEKAVHRNCP